MNDAQQPTETADEVLNIAEHLVQTLGFNSFSYADIARQLGMTKPALHYHFRTKAILGVALIDRYTGRIRDAIDAIDARNQPAMEALASYADIYRDVLDRKRMCMCGMLAAEYETLPRPMRDALTRFFEYNETWLATTLDRGRRANHLDFTEPPEVAGRALLSTLEGAMLISRLHNDPSIFDASVERLLRGFAADTVTAPAH